MPMTTAISPEPSRVTAPISDFDPYAEDVLNNPYPGITDRNLILVKGRVVLEGTGEQLRSQPERLAEYLGV